MNPKLLGSLLVGIIVLTGVYIGSLSLNQQQVADNILDSQQAQVSAALPSGLVAHLPFDDSSLADASGSGNDGSWSGSSSFSSGKIGNGSVSFDGTNYVFIDSQVYQTSAGTVSFWFKPTGDGTLTGSYGGSGAQRAPTLYIEGGKLSWEYTDQFYSTGTGKIVNDGKWHHVAMSYDASNNVKIYLDGTRIVSKNANSPGDFFDQVHIGHYGNTGSFFAKSLVDDFRIYNKALSASDVTALYTYTGETSSPSDTTAPSISSVNVSNITESQATVTWTTNEASDSFVEYGFTSSYTSNTGLNTSKVTSHSATITGLASGTEYNFSVTSVDTAGNKASSSNSKFTTKSATDTTKPSIPSGVTASDITKTGARISWSASTDNIGVTGYKVYRNGSKISDVTNTSYSDSGAGPNTPYSYTVVAVDAAGNASDQSAAVQVKTLPNAPTVSLSANPTSVASGQPSTLSWTSSTDATSCTGSGGSFAGTKAVSGSQTVTTITEIQTSTMYTIYCTGLGGVSTISSVTISVAPAQVVTSSKFRIGDKVQTVNVSNVRRLAALSSRLDGTQYTGSPATVVDDPDAPEGIKNSTDGHFWWKLDFETGVDGYVGEENIKPAVLSTNFKVGDRIQTNEQTNVRTIASLSGTLVGTRALGSIGTIVGGGIQNPTDGFYWWKIDYDGTTVDGYSGQGTLKLYSAATTFTVTTAKAGTGSGTVSCSPSSCSASVGSSVSVTATPASGSTFTGWSGACMGTGACTVTSAGTVTATFTAVIVNPVTFTVTTAKAGNGSGTVTCAPTSCTANIGSTVSVTAVPASGSTFVGWSGACTGTGACTLTSAGTVTATFNTIPVTNDTTKPTVTAFTIPSTSSSLTVTTSVVASDNFGVTGYLITESATAPSATVSGWTLSAPTSYTFATAGSKTLYAWAKDLAGNVSLSRSASVTITLVAAKFTIPQSVIPNAIVNVRQTAAGTLLDTQSTAVPGTTVAGPVTATLSGTSYQWWNIDFNSGVDGWVGQDGLDAYTPPVQASYTITKSGAGSGTVTSSSINCGTSCAASGNVGQTIILTATPAPQTTSGGSVYTHSFAGWSGACTGTSQSCSFTLNSNTTVNAAFNVIVSDPTTTFTVTTAKAGTGSGTVTCSPASCSTNSGSTVLVSATAASGSTLAGLTASPTSAGSCTVNSCALTSAGTVTATFNAEPTGTGNNWYLNASVGTSGNGTSWSSAWKNTNNIVWSSIQPGDTIWVAGGSYSGLNVGKSGTAANLIYIKRILSSDSVATGSGWIAALDSRATFGSLSTPVSYVYIDGRVDMGMRFISSNSSGVPSSYDATNGHYVTVDHVDLVGPSAANSLEGTSIGSALATFNGDNSGVNIGYGYPSHSTNNITVRNSRVRGHPNEFWFAGANNVLIENNKVYDNGAANSATWHGNLMIVNGSNGIVFRNNDVYNWQVEGLYPWGSTSRNWYVYGNVFHDGYGGKNGSTHRFLELRSYSGNVTHGPFYVYNNTITNAWAAITRGDTTVFWSSDSVVRNNLVYNVAGGGIGYLPTNSSNNVTASSNPFASGTFKLAAPIAGVSVPNVTTVLGPVTTFEKDPVGATRGADGVWDVGAYEY